MLTPNFNPFPEIKTERLVLKKITRDDVEDVFALRSSTIVMKYIDRPIHKTHADSIDLIDKNNLMLDSNEGINWGICLKGETKLIGMICLFNFKYEHYRGELGYLLGIDYQQKGIMHESISAVINYGFTQLKLHSIEALVSPNNIASIKILEKNNFIREAYFKDYFLSNGKYVDAAFYSLLTPYKDL